MKLADVYHLLHCSDTSADEYNTKCDYIHWNSEQEERQEQEREEAADKERHWGTEQLSVRICCIFPQYSLLHTEKVQVHIYAYYFATLL